jgi:hypothetical protein
MRSGLALSADPAGLRQLPDPSTLAERAKEIPYDYVARFILEGVAGKRQQDVINISIEGAFVATAIGYGVLPKRSDAPDGISVIPGGVTLGPPVAPAVKPSVQLRDVVAQFGAAFLGPSFNASTGQTINQDELRAQLADTVSCLLRRCCGIEFKYSIVDSGTGRELQNHPIYNIAGLGSADGERPFRAFPKPMVFLPRSTIRIEIEEVSRGPLFAGGELQIVLHGYKVLGAGT